MVALNPIAIALSGLNVSAARLGVSAGNLANAQTPHYRPNEVVAAPLPGGGVSARIVPAAAQGDAAAVDPAQEMVAQIAALHAYRANLATIRAADAMQEALLSAI